MLGCRRTIDEPQIVLPSPPCASEAIVCAGKQVVPNVQWMDQCRASVGRRRSDRACKRHTYLTSWHGSQGACARLDCGCVWVAWVDTGSDVSQITRRWIRVPFILILAPGKNQGVKRPEFMQFSCNLAWTYGEGRRATRRHAARMDAKHGTFCTIWRAIRMISR